MHELRRIGDYADLNHLPLAIHGNGGALATIAAAHVAAASRNFLGLEYHYIETPWVGQFVVRDSPLFKDGNVVLTDAPRTGCGVERRDLPKISRARTGVSGLNPGPSRYERIRPPSAGGRLEDGGAALVCGRFQLPRPRLMVTTMHSSLLESFPITEAQFGLLTSVFLWVYGSLGPFAGFLADRFRRSQVIIVSLLAWSVVTWLTGFARTFHQLLAMRALMGVTEACYIPAAQAFISDYHRGRTPGAGGGCAHDRGLYRRGRGRPGRLASGRGQLALRLPTRRGDGRSLQLAAFLHLARCSARGRSGRTGNGSAAQGPFRPGIGEPVQSRLVHPPVRFCGWDGSGGLDGAGLGADLFEGAL